MADESDVLTCRICGHQEYHRFRDTREKLMAKHMIKHKEKE
jgi:hypothetical protein